MECAFEFKNPPFKYVIDEPSVCPMCKIAMKPVVLHRDVSSVNQFVAQIAHLYRCQGCNRVFHAVYEVNTMPFSYPDVYRPWLTYLAPNNFVERSFGERILELSPNFVRLYNQALQAEQQKLEDIAGMGLRKALEYLVKDYLIYLNPDDEDDIKKSELGKCISNKLDNAKLKAVASRGAWIGNDYAHYQRLFEDKDLSDMHTFINAAVFWISAEFVTDEALNITRRDRK